MDVSIVTGTYNRLSYLQTMVESVRRSFRNVYGLQYELVAVDGGSADGTLEWLRQQPDVRLIEHGTLKGAVKAFNDGAYAATGDYVVLANDDITFEWDSVLRAWVAMQSDPALGVGCFYQDRDRQNYPDDDPGKWRVEKMPVVRDGRQAHDWYGQVCIVPKWLGDRVGWWGDYLHTYGGDNELSAQVYLTGFKVLPIEGTRIRDHSPMDDLRRINNITGAKDPRAVRGAHPDSDKWGRRWTDYRGTRLTGPVIKDTPAYTNPLTKKLRIVYLPIYEQGWTVQKEQKRGLREALAKRAVVYEHDYVPVGLNDELRRALWTMAPDYVITQLHGSSPIGPGQVQEIKEIAHCPVINWNGDYWPDNLLSEDGLNLARSVDLQLTVNRTALERYQSLGIASGYWQIGWEPDGVGCEPGESCDVVFLGNGYSKERAEFVKWLRSLPNITFHLWGNGWPDSWAKGQSTYDFKAACRAYNGAKLSIGDSQWPDSGFVSNRVMQALAAGGAVLLHQYFRGMDELGLVDGQTCGIWHTRQDLVDRINFYLTHEEDRRRVAIAGKELALREHSFDRRVDELFGMLQGASWEGGWR